MGTTGVHAPPIRKSSGITVKHFPEVSGEAVSIIAGSSPMYGSHGTALLVAVEILAKEKEPIRVTYRNVKKNHASYKLIPRATELIHQLTPVYGSTSRVIDACAMVIKELQIKGKARMR